MSICIDKLVQLRLEIKLPKDYFYGAECISGERIDALYSVDCAASTKLNRESSVAKDNDNFARLEAASNLNDVFFEINLFGRSCLHLNRVVR
jgi:hypothetical protein